MKAACSNENKLKCVVGIGASAGGLQALQPIVSSLVEKGTTAYVIAHHLSPSKPCTLVELLAKKTLLNVSWAVHNEPLIPNHIYICPPGFDIEVVATSLVLYPITEAQLNSPSIDRLFRSLAECRQDNAVAAVLSGSGHDGLAGAEAVSAAGGVVIAQTSADSIQTGMPNSIIQGGLADLIGNTSQIGEWLNSTDQLSGVIADVLDKT